MSNKDHDDSVDALEYAIEALRAPMDPPQNQPRANVQVGHQWPEKWPPVPDYYNGPSSPSPVVSRDILRDEALHKLEMEVRIRARLTEFLNSQLAPKNLRDVDGLTRRVLRAAKELLAELAHERDVDVTVDAVGPAADSLKRLDAIRAKRRAVRDGIPNPPVGYRREELGDYQQALEIEEGLLQAAVPETLTLRVCARLPVSTDMIILDLKLPEK